MISCKNLQKNYNQLAVLKGIDLEIQAKEILFVRAQINAYIAEFTDQPIEKIELDCDRDFYMTPEQARDYGLIDEVIVTKDKMKKPAMPPLL